MNTGYYNEQQGREVSLTTICPNQLNNIKCQQQLHVLFADRHSLYRRSVCAHNQFDSPIVRLLSNIY